MASDEQQQQTQLTDPESGRRCVDGECVMIDGKCETIATAADEVAEPAASLERQVFAEFLGTAFLVCTIIGSGMMGDNLSPDDGVGALGQHARDRELGGAAFALFVPAQVFGAVFGAFVAHAMFMRRNGVFDGKDRDSDGELFSEFVATFGLLMTIFGGIRAKKDVPMLVGLYITAGYWFTSSTSFANPAVTIGRSFTDTFASISPKSFPAYFAGQVLGLLCGLPACEWLFSRKAPLAALATLARKEL
ncbi:water channel [Aureococcus anophagefferens]|nr:water channel [Aureococcus anophagefferens]